MSEQRTHSAAGLLICQQCGVVLKTQNKTCRDCGSVTSRHSTTLIPVLVINRKPATAPQHLKPENDPLIMERVVTRCKFNEAMTPKEKRFHGSRAFFSNQTYDQAGNAPSAPSAPPAPSVTSADVNVSNAGPPKNEEFDPFARSPQGGQAVQNSPAMPMPAPDAASVANEAPVADQVAPVSPGNSAPSAVPFFDEDRPRSSDEQNSSGQNNLVPTGTSERAEGSNPNGTPTSTGFVDQSAALPLAGSAGVPPTPINNNNNEPAGRRLSQSETSDPKVVRQAHPSYMVADSFLLVVQDNDGKTISVTQTIDGPELEAVFGLLPAPSTFNICASQVMPEQSVSLSGESLSFHDANKEEEFSVAPEVDTAINIDSRLAFEEGLSRVAALRLQGALGSSGVLGFESSSSDQEFRKKFTRKPFSGTDSDESSDQSSDSGTTDDVIAEPPKLKERSVFNPKKASGVEKLEKIESIGNIKPITPAKNPLAMVGAILGIVAVFGVVGFVGYQKFTEFSAAGSGQSSSSTNGAALPKLWHVVLTRTADVKTIYQDFQLQVDQSGNNLSGKGRDEIGDFTLSGELGKDSTITMQKQYDTAGYIWPIMFSGKIAPAQDGSFVSGSYFWRKSDQERVQGDWQASPPLQLPTSTGLPGTNPPTPDQIQVPANR